MRSRDKKLVLAEIDKAIEAGVLNEWIISLVDWIHTDLYLPVGCALKDENLQQILKNEPKTK